MKHHETTLVLFTAASTVGAGLVAAGPLAPLLGIPTITWTTPVGALLLGVALGLSLLHLGQPRRLFLAARGLQRSPVSQEVLLANLALAAAAGEVLAGHLEKEAFVAPFRIGAAALAAFFLLALGRVYRLPGQQTWGLAESLRPLLLGLAWGLLVCLASGPDLGYATPVVLGLLLLDTGIARFRWRRLLGPDPGGSPAYPSLWAKRRAILGARLLLVNLLPAALLGTGFPAPSAAVLGLGLLVDRFAFYALAAQLSNESEIQRVEQLL